MARFWVSADQDLVFRLGQVIAAPGKYLSAAERNQKRVENALHGMFYFLHPE